MKREKRQDMRRQVGFHGEELAAEHLEKEGWEIVARNYETKLGEIDLVARRVERWAGRSERILAFVEVKTRRTQSGPPPEVGVDRKKRRKLVRLARCFLQREGYEEAYVRFDVVAVDLSDERLQIDHFEGAFDADGCIW